MVFGDHQTARGAWFGRGRVHSWVPQLFARYAYDTGLLADCPSSPTAGGDKAQRAQVVLEAACARGWAYWRLEPPPAVVAANLRWLVGYTPLPAPGPVRTEHNTGGRRSRVPLAAAGCLKEMVRSPAPGVLPVPPCSAYQSGMSPICRRKWADSMAGRGANLGRREAG